MFCPKCRSEYREGITVCPDCGVPLVEKLRPVTKELCEFDDEKVMDLCVNFLKSNGLDGEDEIFTDYDEDKETYIISIAKKKYAKAESAMNFFDPDQVLEALESAKFSAGDTGGEEENSDADEGAYDSDDDADEAENDTSENEGSADEKGSEADDSDDEDKDSENEESEDTDGFEDETEDGSDEEKDASGREADDKDDSEEDDDETEEDDEDDDESGSTGKKKRTRSHINSKTEEEEERDELFSVAAPAKEYKMLKERYTDERTSGAMWLILGIIGTIYICLSYFNVIPVSYSKVMYIIIELIFAIMLIYGIRCIAKAREYLDGEEEEEKSYKEKLSWLMENVDEDTIDSWKDQDAAVEENDLTILGRIRATLFRQYPDEDRSFLELIVNDFFNRIMGYDEDPDSDPADDEEDDPDEDQVTKGSGADDGEDTDDDEDSDDDEDTDDDEDSDEEEGSEDNKE